MNREIKSIQVEQGFKHQGNVISSENGKIKSITKSGEMSPVEWFRQGNIDINGKYVIYIEYGESNEERNQEDYCADCGKKLEEVEKQRKDGKCILCTNEINSDDIPF